VFGFLSGRPGSALGPFRAVKEDYISFRREVRFRPNDNSGIFELPTINMYPAATVVVEPNVPAEDVRESVCMSWKVAPGESQTSSKQLRQHNPNGIIIERRREPQKIYVPAEIDLSLEFTLYRNRHVPAVEFDSVKLRQGQTLDLGRIDFEPRLRCRITVQLLTADSQPIQDNKLSCKIADARPYQLPPTDANGMTYFNAPPNSTGELTFRYSDPFSNSIPPSMRWQISGAEDQDKPLVFRLPEEKEYVFKGQVLNGITGSPMPDTIVLAFRRGQSIGTGSLTAEQWNALRALEAPLNLNAPALAPVADIFDPMQITISDASGRFQFAISEGQVIMLMTAGAIGENLIGTIQAMENPAPDPRRGPRTRSIETDQYGSIILPPLKMFPAGKITLQANIPVPSIGEPPRIRCYAFPSANATVPWVEEIKKAAMLRECELQPNKPQTASFPADIELDLRIVELRSGRWVPIHIPGIRLQHAQALDLGQLTFEPPMNIFLKVIDSGGNPVEGAPISLRTDCSFHPKRINRTDENGLTSVPIAPNCKALFSVVHYELSPGNHRPKEYKESVEYQIGGPEDKDKKFTFTLSDEMVKRLSQQQRIR